MADTGVFYCLEHACRIQRQGGPETWCAALGRVSETCAQPERCGHAAAGCRKVNFDYLADVARRLRVYRQLTGQGRAGR